MGYDGAFTRICSKINNQEQLDYYGEKLRFPLYKVIGKEDFYKFEHKAINLEILDNSWLQVEFLNEILSEDKIRNYENDENKYTLITKDILKQYIIHCGKFLEDKLKKDENDESCKLLKNDIEILENLYESFNWDRHTLVFSYTY